MRPLPLAAALLAACVATRPGDRGNEGGPPMAVAPPTGPRSVAAVVFPAHVSRPGPAEERRIVEAVAELWSPDFQAYVEAGSRLVALGEPAIPYLGYFGNVDREASKGQRRNVVPILLDAILTKLPSAEFPEWLSSPYRDVRAAAARVVGERGLREHALALVRLLYDPQESVRRAAVASLRRLSTRFFGYRPDSDAEDRAPAATLWHAFFAGTAKDASTP